MGWCSGTIVFDKVCDLLLSDEKIDKKEFLDSLICELWDLEWDCEQESEYWDHPLVQEVFKERRPEWFEDEE